MITITNSNILIIILHDPNKKTGSLSGNKDNEKSRAAALHLALSPSVSFNSPHRGVSHHHHSLLPESSNHESFQYDHFERKIIPTKANSVHCSAFPLSYIDDCCSCMWPSLPLFLWNKTKDCYQRCFNILQGCVVKYGKVNTTKLPGI